MTDPIQFVLSATLHNVKNIEATWVFLFFFWISLKKTKVKETMNYFRAIVRKDERSERALKLTKEVIVLNSANYTAWYYRRLCVESLKSSLKEELEFCEDVANENQKNYQVWYHRQWCLEKVTSKEGGEGEGGEKGKQNCEELWRKELEFTREMLLEDSKNYHVWSYRQYVVEKFQLWEEELGFVDEMLQTDIRNNSAWNERYFVVSKWKGWNEESKKEEIEFSLSMIKKAPNNQSPWLYLKGIVKNSSEEEKNKFGILQKACELKDKFSICPHVFSFLVDLLEQKSEISSLEEAIKYCDLLSNNLDNIHSKYWNYRKQSIEKKMK